MMILRRKVREGLTEDENSEVSWNLEKLKFLRVGAKETGSAEVIDLT
ncbi:hypothetical protein [Sedimentisphaera salicampi]|nr:hypothetical protein [Sedimentisphaera salicampi]